VWFVPPRSYAPELMDLPDHDAEDLRRVLHELATINRLLGGTRALLGALAPRLARWPAGRPYAILDVGTGGADLPLAIVRLARRLGVSVRVTAVDRDPRTAAIAADHVREFPEVRVVRADAMELPFPDHSFDATTASLVLHHFREEPITRLLERLRALSRDVVIVNDLRRHAVPWRFIRLATRLARSHPMIRHDGPLSVLRGFTASELGTLARRAGAPSWRVVRRWPYRLVMTLPGTLDEPGRASEA
jgi:SAM-dependent methyltransferase